jgi:hypothetical protein
LIYFKPRRGEPGILKQCVNFRCLNEECDLENNSSFDNSNDENENLIELNEEFSVNKKENNDKKL